MAENQPFTRQPFVEIVGYGKVPVPANINSEEELGNYIRAYVASVPSTPKDVANVVANSAKKAPFALVGSTIDLARTADEMGGRARRSVLDSATNTLGVPPVPQSVIDAGNEMNPSIISAIASIPAGMAELTDFAKNKLGIDIGYQAKTTTGQNIQGVVDPAMMALASRNPARLLSGAGIRQAGRDVLTTAAGAGAGNAASSVMNFSPGTEVGVNLAADLGTQALLTLVGRKTVPGIAKNEAMLFDDFTALNSSLWKRLDDMKVRVNPGTLKNELKIVTDANPEYLDPKGFSRANYYLTSRLGNTKLPGFGSFAWLQKIRSDIAADLRSKNVDGSEKRALSDILGAIDDTIEKGAFQPTISGTSPISSQEIASLYNDARSMHRQVIKATKIETILSQAPLENNPQAFIQNEIRKILRDPKQAKMFSEAEMAYLKSPVNRSQFAETLASGVKAAGTSASITGDILSALSVKAAADLAAGAIRFVTRTNPQKATENLGNIVRLSAEKMRQAEIDALTNRKTRMTSLKRGVLPAIYASGLLDPEMPPQEQQ